jgi:hypothetical protein
MPKEQSLDKHLLIPYFGRMQSQIGSDLLSASIVSFPLILYRSDQDASFMNGNETIWKNWWKWVGLWFTQNLDKQILLILMCELEKMKKQIQQHRDWYLLRQM